MSSRTWVYSRLTTGNPTLQGLVGSRVFSSTSLDETPNTKPFIVIRALAHLSGFRGDDDTLTRDDSYQFFVHDDPGDYMQIDTILGLIRQQFDGVVDQAEGIIRSTWIEDSEDFRDDDMGTILKYGRYQIRVRN